MQGRYMGIKYHFLNTMQ